MKRRGRPFRFLWITDPWETLDHARDTTLRLAEEAVALGHESWWCDVRAIRVEDGKTCFEASPLAGGGAGRTAGTMARGEAQVCTPADFDQLHYRVDPPVDLAYLHPLQLLELAWRGRKRPRSTLVNPPAALMGVNEKLEATLLEGLAPAGIVSANWESLARFGTQHGATVAKPLHLAQSKGVTKLEWPQASGADLKSCFAPLATLTEQFTRPVLLQAFLPGIARGETRLWLLDGRLLASVRKLPLDGDFKVQIDQGSRVEAHTPTARERRAAKKIGAHLRKLGVRLAAVDLIDGKVTDFNVTSPGLLVQMEAVSGENLAGTIIRQLVRRR